MRVYLSEFLPSNVRIRELDDQSQCPPALAKEHRIDNPQPCTGPKAGETYLRVYNCDYIRPNKPQRFARAMKQIYRTSHVLSHFVHYSTVTADAAITYDDFMASNREKNESKQFVPFTHSSAWERQSPEIFLDALTQGALIHARGVLPYETMNRDEACRLGSRLKCNAGHLCDDSVEFKDAVHNDNVFRNPDTGAYCNCWKNPVVEDTLVPLLEKELLKS